MRKKSRDIASRHATFEMYTEALLLMSREQNQADMGRSALHFDYMQDRVLDIRRAGRAAPDMSPLCCQFEQQEPQRRRSVAGILLGIDKVE